MKGTGCIIFKHSGSSGRTSSLEVQINKYSQRLVWLKRQAARISNSFFIYPRVFVPSFELRVFCSSIL